MLPILNCSLMIVLSFYLIGCGESEQATSRERAPAPVEAAPVEQGLIRNQRTFSGSLRAGESFSVSPKVGGRIEAIYFNLGDQIPRGGVVARLEDAEFRQDLARAEADLLVAWANFVEAESTLTLTRRAITRTETLRERGVASEAELDAVLSELLAKEARVEVFRAEIARAEAAVEFSKIRLGHTEVRAQWRGVSNGRFVSRRFADEGQNIGPNEDILEIVDLDPIIAVFFVSERDYAGLGVGQRVELRTDAFWGETFSGLVSRIAPVFEESSRQARVEVSIENVDRRLKPGMFMQVEVEVARDPGAIIVPFEAVERRRDEYGVFVVSSDGSTALWRPVSLGIREGERQQVFAHDLGERVITLGQQLVRDGSPVVVRERGSPQIISSERVEGSEGQ